MYRFRYGILIGSILILITMIVGFINLNILGSIFEFFIIREIIIIAPFLIFTFYLTIGMMISFLLPEKIIKYFNKLLEW